MKFISLDGKEVKVKIIPSNNPIGKTFRSALQTLTGERLIEYYPQEQICEDWVLSKSRLSLDFFIPRLKIAIEVNPDLSGHAEYTPFFHGQITSGKFAKQKRNDTDKAKFCDINNIILLYVYNKKDLDKLWPI